MSTEDEKVQQFQIGDRVRRAITERYNLTMIVGWRTGVVVGASQPKRGAGSFYELSWQYDVLWDNTSEPQRGYFSSSLCREENINA